MVWMMLGDIMEASRLLIVCSFLHIIYAANVDLFYPYGIALDQNLNVIDGDDIASEEYELKNPIVFYSERKNSVWISTNGLVSFDGELKEYTGELFPLGREVIAPFYADVDIRTTGEVFFRESSDEASLDQAALDINRIFRPESRFEPASLLIVTWVNVGSYQNQFDKKNTFQLVIATDGYDSYAMFIYMDDQHQWIQADLKPNVPQVAAQAGFDSGQQNLPPVVLPGSGLPEAANWNRKSNAGIAGVWMYKLGYGTTITEPNPDQIDTDPVTDAPKVEQCAGACSTAGFCDGQCCVCKPEYFGNGKSCTNATAIWMNGQITGNLNDDDLTGERVSTYVAIDDSRTYTAVGKIPPKTGYPLQMAVSLGELMGWLFAHGGSVNGFDITGGILNYTATIAVGRDILSMTVKMNGIKDDGTPEDMVVSFNGNLPMREGFRALYSDHTVDYTKVRPGMYRSQATRVYQVNGVDYDFDLTEEITFEECNPAPSVYRVSHSSYYVQYNENELTTRFVLVSETEQTQVDVCANNNCHYNADCVPKGDNYTCTCKQGYDGSGYECQDIDECLGGLTTCSEHADCMNTDGAYICTCKTGYSGDGYYCGHEEERLSCRDIRCGENGDCELRGDEPYCTCNLGFRGDGYNCQPIVVTCDQAPDICDIDARCVFSTDNNRYECVCIDDGFSGDGDESCDTPVDASCAYCAFNAQCIYNNEGRYYQCQCNAGYSGNGRTCQLIEEGGEGQTDTTTTLPTTPTTTRPADVCLNNRCDENADCIARGSDYSCTCRGGYQGDGYRCQEDPRLVDSCYYNRDLCHINSDCIAERDGTYKCVCREGYLSSGRDCVEADCQSHRECGENARCQFSRTTDKYQCECNSGFQGDGQLCTPTSVALCNEVNACHPDADCYDTPLGPKCVCRGGYVGDGITCSAVQEDCMTRPTLCDRNAVCSRTSVGDHVCICNPGYRGDGTSCTPLNEKGNYLLFSQGMSVFRVPFYQAGSDTGRRILYKKGESLVGLAADCKDRQFYYSDISSGTISRASLDNTSDSHVIIDGLSSPEGLAVDWISRTLYFTDSALDRIEVSDLEGKYRKILIDENLTNPRSIVLEPSSGKMYWTDWNRASPRIEVANMDGTGRKVLVDTDLGLPNGLTYDYYRQQLCWADAGTRKLECINPDGTGRTLIYDLMNYPFSLTTFRDNFYWTDWQKNAIQSIPRGGDVLGASILFPSGGNGKSYSIEPVPSQCLPGVNRCEYNNGDCKFLCLPTSGYDATCACPDNINQDECNLIFRS